MESQAAAVGAFHPAGHHKSLFPLEWTDWVGFVSTALALLLAASSGIGGGGLLVPINLIIFGQWLGVGYSAHVLRSNGSLRGLAPAAFPVRLLTSGPACRATQASAPPAASLFPT